MSLFRDVVQPGIVEEGTVRYLRPALLHLPDTDARYRCEKRGKETLGCAGQPHQDDALLALTRSMRKLQSA